MNTPDTAPADDRRSLRQRFETLQQRLQCAESFWRPAPFHDLAPRWSVQHPALLRALQALDDRQVEQLAGDDRARQRWLSPYLPELAGLSEPEPEDALPTRELPPPMPGFEEGIPTRKRLQIEAFARHVPAGRAPLVEWCAGKGHLGRRLATADHRPVYSLEIDTALCAVATRKARNAGGQQHIIPTDVLRLTTPQLLSGRTVIALHACGELHRALVRSASRHRPQACYIAPCCYHLGNEGDHQPLSALANLPLRPDELRLAVTETVTAPAREHARLRRDQAWKQGFLALHAHLLGQPLDRFRPVPQGWFSDGFARFCTRLAAREGLALPRNTDWHRWEMAGEARRQTVCRLELVRHAYRRPLELWLVLDLALALEAQGYAVQLGRFCERHLTPRNLLICATQGTRRAPPGSAAA